MSFYADLHIHSKYSRATSRDLDLERLAWWAGRKGIAVVGTGDCVHPAWLAELKEKLIPDGSGLFRLKPDLEAQLAQTLPALCQTPTRFMLSTEISTIYKKDDKTRKIHHLIFVPDFAAADKLAAKLASVGNIASDGRPILGLDSRDLLEIALETGPGSYLVPAHIWTPWFAALGSQSGFDSLQACYGDLARHVFAVETGLSSDPAMNWRVSMLDGYRLISNSDAHSPSKLGREATRFSCALDYSAIWHALAHGDGYEGTVEFYPEEGKYHLDGHRACEVRLEPKETLALGGLCPSCGRPVTIGVAHRVEMLADRREDEIVLPPTAGKVQSFVPLPEILSEILGIGSGSQAVQRAYDRLVAELGPELAVLGQTPLDAIAAITPLLGEAIDRLRSNAVHRQAGYDGEYGIIRLFTQDELACRNRGNLLFDAPVTRKRPGPALLRLVQTETETKIKQETPPSSDSALSQAPTPTRAATKRKGALAALDDDQAMAAQTTDAPLIVMAGPGSGKTRMLTHRIAHLVLERGVPAANCLAITFTRRATEELRARLSALLRDQAQLCAVHSFHSLGLAILRAHREALQLPSDFKIATQTEWQKALAEAMALSESRALGLLKAVSARKRAASPAQGEESVAMDTLKRLGQERGWVDFDDLVGLAAGLLESDPQAAIAWQRQFTHICADEFQDVDEMQYRLLTRLAGDGQGLCVIGDPDQAIYGFRGAEAACFERFAQDFPDARTVRLDRNYRSSQTIVAASSAIVARAAPAISLGPVGEPITLHVAPDEREEADFIAATIEDLMGGHDLLTARRHKTGSLSFADFAVLYRTDAQALPLRKAFDKAGIPYKKSAPLPLAAHEGVALLLRLLQDRPLQAREEKASYDSALLSALLSDRLSAAREQAQKNEQTDPALLSQAYAWLCALAAEPSIANDETRFLEHLAMRSEADFWDARADRVSLLTMHAAKGLEFPVTFIVGLEEGLMPFSFSYAQEDEREDGQEIDAERRLLYVAMTRAKTRLFLTRARERFSRGHLRAPLPSRFLTEIPPALTEISEAAKRAQRPKQYRLF